MKNEKELELKDALRAWIVRKNGKIQSNELKNDTAIIEQRIISSLQIMDLILFLEELGQMSVDVEKLKPGVFGSIDRIYENFLQSRDTNDD